jgi:hypothetical protein
VIQRVALTVFFISTALAAWPLDSVFARGDSCIQIEWTPDSVNTNPAWYQRYGSGCKGVDTAYRHCDFIPGRPYRGIAYSYGGEDPWYLFRSRLTQGFLAGSHQCHYNVYGDPSDTVTGADCSGFLCFIWNIPRLSTVMLVQGSQFIKIGRTQIETGDALVRSGYHAVFVAEADDPTNAVIWESSSSLPGCRERITDLTSPAWDLYTPLRYPPVNSGIRENPGVHRTRPSVSIEFRSGDMLIRSRAAGILSATIVTLSGRCIAAQPLPPHSVTALNPANTCSPGVYFVIVTDGDVCFLTQKFTIHM